MKWFAGYHHFFVPACFGYLRVLLNIVHMAATHRVCWVHLKHRKRDFILYIIKQPDVFFPPQVKDTELLIFLHHPDLSSSSYNNSQYTSNAFTVLQVFRHPPPRQVNTLHSGLANSVREQIYLLKASWQKCQKQINKL